MYAPATNPIKPTKTTPITTSHYKMQDTDIKYDDLMHAMNDKDVENVFLPLKGVTVHFVYKQLN